MKFTLPLTVFAIAAAVDAAALPEADPWCRFPGQPCGKVKREAEAEPWCRFPGQPCGKVKREAEADPWCRFPGQPCGKVKRAADAFAAAIGANEILARDAEPTAEDVTAQDQIDGLAHVISSTLENADEYYNHLTLAKRFPWCRFPGQPCGKVKREAEATPWCRFPGQPCGKVKREAAPEPEPWCRFPGQPCGKVKREAEAEPWCRFPGQPCGKAKRAAEAVLQVIHEVETRDVAPEDLAKRDACYSPSGACTVATRDLHAIYNAARSIVAENSN